MFFDEVVLCGASAYTKKFYLNEDFEALPQEIKEDLKIMCVLYTEDVGGAIQMIFDEEGHLQIKTAAEENDLLYDEIGGVLKIKEMQRENEELFESLELFYRVFCLGELDEED